MGTANVKGEIERLCEICISSIFADPPHRTGRARGLKFAMYVLPQSLLVVPRKGPLQVNK